MNFAAFLRQLKMKSGFASARELFDHLGGEAKLKMTLRNFQLIESDQQPPTPKAFTAIFRELPRDEYKAAVMAFFKSFDEGSESLMEYIENNLTPAYHKTEESIWESDRPKMIYSEEQMTFLTQNHEAMRLHHRLLLWEHVPMKILEGREEVAKQLVKLDLAQMKKEGLYPSRALYRVPRHEDAAPSAARKATRLLLAHLETYISEEGSPDQDISYALQLVDESVAKTIIEEQKKFKKWIQNVASTRTDASLVPFFFLGVSKKLSKRDL